MLKEIFDRRSIRHYTDEPVTKEQLTEMLRAAMNAPSARNCQEWRFVVITQPADLAKICQFHPYAQMMLQAKAAIIVSADMNEAYTEAHAYLDCGAAIENLLLEAVHQGLSTCWCGLAPAEDRVAGARKAFSIPACQMPMGVIAIGHSAQSSAREDQYDEGKITWRG